MWLQKTLGVMGLQPYYHAWGLDASILSQKGWPKSKSYSKNQILMRGYYEKAEILMVIKEISAVFEYVDIFYNRQRFHESNNYLTPEEYYVKAAA